MFRYVLPALLLLLGATATPSRCQSNATWLLSYRSAPTHQDGNLSVYLTGETPGRNGSVRLHRIGSRDDPAGSHEITLDDGNRLRAAFTRDASGGFHVTLTFLDAGGTVHWTTERYAAPGFDAFGDPTRLHTWSLSISLPGDRVYRFALAEESVTTGRDVPVAVPPDRFKLHQNYPNPFNPSTVLRYTLRQPGYVTLRIHDGLGRHIRTLVQDSRPAGEHSASFDASALPSGVYFYTLQVGSFADTKSMLLLR